MPRRGGEIIKAALGGQTSGAGHMGEKAPPDIDDGGYLEFGPQPDAILETNIAPESSRRPPSAGGGVRVPPAISVQPEVPDVLLATLKSASIIDEHRAQMGAVIKEI